MSINAKLMAAGLIIAMLLGGLSIVLQQSSRSAQESMQAVFSRGIDPLELVEKAGRANANLAETFLQKSANGLDPNRPLSADDGGELLSSLAAILADLRAAMISVEDPVVHERLNGLATGLSRLRQTQGDVTHRLVRRELSGLVDDFDTSINAFRSTILDMRTASAASAARIDHLLWIGGMSVFAVGGLLLALLSMSIGRPVRAAASSLNGLVEAAGGSAPTVAAADPMTELNHSVETVEKTFVALLDRAEEREAKLEKRLTDEATRERKRFDTTIGSISEGFCLLDTHLNLVSANETFRQMFPGLGARADARTLRDDEDLGRFLDTEADVALHQTSDGRQLRMRRRRGVEGGGMLLLFDDVTEQEAVTKELERLSGQDLPTGLANRSRFFERLEAALRNERQRADIAILAVDIEGFRAINTTFGHAVGDQLLRDVGERLRTLIGGRDLLARLGGDEFGIVQVLNNQPGAGETLCRRIIADLGERPITVAGRSFPLRMAIGLVPLKNRPRNAGYDAHGLMQDCEMALHRAKADGGGYRLFDLSLRERLESRKEMEADLRTALERGEFELYFQPIVDMRRRVVSTLEALVRWRHPERGLVSPAIFIPLMEETGLIEQLGSFVVREACQQAAKWSGDLAVAINLSPLQFKSRSLPMEIDAALRASGLKPGRFQIEVTESLFLENSEEVLTTLEAIRRLGVLISMDDFGTGYSSLGYLSRFPFDKIKIDQSFVRDMSKPQSFAIVRAVIGLAASMRMSVVAEGVETAEQAAVLEREGCHEMQGFAFAKPMPAADLQTVIARIETSLRRRGLTENRALQA